MAAPLSYRAFIAALKGAGLTVIEEQTNGRSPELHTRTADTRPWGPVNGVMIHHTVTSGHVHTVDLCRRGYEGLPGPLCHGVICKAGHVHVVGYGRTNHAGLGDREVFGSVVRESYATRPPAPVKAVMDGNPHFYGFECENKGDGADPWPAVQLAAIERAAAALCRAHGWTEKSVIGHLEWQPGKVDPRGFTMPDLRTRIRARLTGTPAPTPPPTPKPAPTTGQRLTALEKRVTALEKR